MPKLLSSLPIALFIPVGSADGNVESGSLVGAVIESSGFNGAVALCEDGLVIVHGILPARLRGRVAGFGDRSSDASFPFHRLDIPEHGCWHRVLSDHPNPSPPGVRLEAPVSPALVGYRGDARYVGICLKKEVGASSVLSVDHLLERRTVRRFPR